MSEQRQDKNLLSEPHKTESDEIEIDLVDIFARLLLFVENYTKPLELVLLLE